RWHCRHAAVGIGRVVVGEGFAWGYRDEVGEVEEPEVEVNESALELRSAKFSTNENICLFYALQTQEIPFVRANIRNREFKTPEKKRNDSVNNSEIEIGNAKKTLPVKVAGSFD
ncbi:hypothetical protein H2201_009129, partial [Coniosporium apollinis]